MQVPNGKLPSIPEAKTLKSTVRQFALNRVLPPLPALPKDLQEAIVPFTTVLSNQSITDKAKDATYQLGILEAMNPDTLSEQIMTRLNELPMMKPLKRVLLAERANVSHPQLNKITELAQQWVQHPSPVNKARGLALKMLVDNLNGIVSAITRQLRRVMVLGADKLETVFQQAARTGKKLTDKLTGEAVENQPITQHYKALELAGRKGRQLIRNLRSAVAKHHPQFTDDGIKQAYTAVEQAHKAPRNTLPLDALALRWMTTSNQPPGYWAPTTVA